VHELLNSKSGLLGLSGTSADLRMVERAAGAGDRRAELALALFAYRARKYLGAYAAVLGGLDAVAFTGGIGEHSASMRARICAGLGFLGLELDAAQNAAAIGDREAVISADGSPVEVWVIPTDEELEIAAATADALQAMSFAAG
jgi:acetate kinase